jgi:hypothetical protein
MLDLGGAHNPADLRVDFKLYGCLQGSTERIVL